MFTKLIFVSLLSTVWPLPRLSPQPAAAFEQFPFPSDIKPTNQHAAASVDDLPADDDALFIFRALSGFRNMEVDGVASASPKDFESESDVPTPSFEDYKDLPQMPFDGFKDSVVPLKEDIEKPQPGVAPKFTGSYIEEHKKGEKESEDFIDGPVSNPASYFLDGANFEKVPAPKCRMIGCTGPLPNDGSVDFSLPVEHQESACHQSFVPLNGCVDNKGYPMGMLCQICCDCSKPFITEFKKSRGVRTGYHEA